MKIDSTVAEAGQKFLKHVAINNHKIEAYVDFGSDCSLIRLSDANILDSKRENTNLPVIKGFGNSLIKPLFKIKVNIKIDDIETDL